MKYIIAFIVGLLFNVSVSNAQLSLNLAGFATEKISKSIKEGDMVQLKSFFKDDYNNEFAVVSYGGGLSELINLNKLSKINFKVKNQKEFWQDQALTNGVYENIISNGLQYKLRKELEDETIEYINYTKANNLIFNDSYLESYLYSIAYRIYPNNIGDGRLCIFTHCCIQFSIVS